MVSLLVLENIPEINQYEVAPYVKIVLLEIDWVNILLKP